MSLRFLVNQDIKLSSVLESLMSWLRGSAATQVGFSEADKQASVRKRVWDRGILLYGEKMGTNRYERLSEGIIHARKLSRPKRGADGVREGYLKKEGKMVPREEILLLKTRGWKW